MWGASSGILRGLKIYCMHITKMNNLVITVHYGSVVGPTVSDFITMYKIY